MTLAGVKPRPKAKTSSYVPVVKPKPQPAQPFGVRTVDRNERRRHRYSTDEDYQETLKLRSRASYRASNGVELANCLRSLDFYRTLAKSKRVILPNGKTVREMPVMTLANVANCLQKIYQTIWRWKREGMIPEPALRLVDREHAAGVYHVDEVQVLIEEIGNHERCLAYYRANHTEVRDAIFSRIDVLRSQWR